jgi:GDPmannose 4,6-dehydratase
VASRRALITGITGQDGSYLAQLLLAKGYVVHGIVREPGLSDDSVVAAIARDAKATGASLHTHVGDIRNTIWMSQLLGEIRPHEVYNLAAQSHVALSFLEPELTHEINYVAATHLLDAVCQIVPDARYFQASSSEMFGLTPPPQNESSAFLPQSPYALAKAGAHVAVLEAREGGHVFAVNGVSFNHESPRRSTDFVTRKITHGVAAIVRGDAEFIKLGNLDAIRDWGYAPEFVDGMWRSLQHDEPQDYVFASGRGHSVREFVQFACDAAGLDWRNHVHHEYSLDRPHDVKATVGDASRAKRVLGWSATTTAEQLASIMVEADVARGRDPLVRVDVPQLSTWQ